MDVGIVRDELKDLSYIEQMLIARIHPELPLALNKLTSN